MPTLLMRLAGPMQSWGTTSRFDERDSQLEPSKSGVLGLICAAMGRDRAEPIADLAQLKMGIRVDREGVLMRDYHTATGVMSAAGKVDRGRTVVSPRYFLADAVFLVGLYHEEQVLLQQILTALKFPVWPLALGRKSFPPGQPVWLEDGISNSSLAEALKKWPSLIDKKNITKSESVRLLLEHESEGAVRFDQPLGPFSERQFGPRHIVSEAIYVPVQADS